MLPQPAAGGPGEGFELGATLVPGARGGRRPLRPLPRRLARLLPRRRRVGQGDRAPRSSWRARRRSSRPWPRARPIPAALLDRVNRSLCRDNDAGMFVTAVAGVLDLASGELAFAVAGHEPPVLVPADGAPRARPVEGGRVLGLIEASDFPVNRLRLGKGDAVVLYTDGVSEAQDASGGFFGVERLVADGGLPAARGGPRPDRGRARGRPRLRRRGPAVGRHHHPHPPLPRPARLSAPVRPPGLPARASPAPGARSRAAAGRGPRSRPRSCGSSERRPWAPMA